MTALRDDTRVTDRARGAVRHFIGPVGKTVRMHRVSDRAEWRARAPRGRAR
jgi:hypothetical protein